MYHRSTRVKITREDKLCQVNHLITLRVKVLLSMDDVLAVPNCIAKLQVLHSRDERSQKRFIYNILTYRHKQVLKGRQSKAEYLKNYTTNNFYDLKLNAEHIQLLLSWPGWHPGVAYPHNSSLRDWSQFPRSEAVKRITFILYWLLYLYSINSLYKQKGSWQNVLNSYLQSTILLICMQPRAICSSYICTTLCLGPF